jgi:hypothetical protein
MKKDRKREKFPSVLAAAITCWRTLRYEHCLGDHQGMDPEHRVASVELVSVDT